jgi:hypothetical protein
VVGVITNNSVEATVRMAGIATYFVSDGCFAFGRTDWNGTPRSAEDVHAGIRSSGFRTIKPPR